MENDERMFPNADTIEFGYEFEDGSRYHTIIPRKVFDMMYDEIIKHYLTKQIT